MRTTILSETLTPSPHRLGLARQAVEILNRYTHFHSEYEVTFSLVEADEQGLPRILCHFHRFDGVPFSESPRPQDRKYTHLKDQTAVLRPFYMPMMRAEIDETPANVFSALDFDYAAILGYGKDAEGQYVMKALYLPPTDAFIAGRHPDEDGIWRNIPLPSFRMHQMSLDPRKTFARALYLAERMSEALEYEYDKYGFFFSNPR